ncbi:PAS domain S-box protein [Nostoc sp. MS1]|uniref:PAS domain S-box protein n=1 Tax=Nostoc sp. MS1 TaxID=2764711 RepID=UPI001CC41170|nr:PAS domain S-box protein [Nostoc sp. MS1]BCL38139.1 hypothetical protein NSMS1_45860 [Nostoc sp. MS1]
MKLYLLLLPFFTAVSFTIIALLLTLCLEALVSEAIVSIFYIAIIASTWYGGGWSGLVTVILSVLAINYTFVEPRYQFWLYQPKDIFHLSIFLLVGLIINLLVRNFRKSNQKIQQLSQKLAQENAEQLRMALSAAQMGMWDWNLLTGEIKWSPEHEKLFGLAVGSFDGRYETFDAHLHPEDRSLLKETLQKAIQTHSNYRCEFRIIWLDGSIHWMEGLGQAFYDETGQPVRMTGTVMAIDERKRSQILLQQQFEQQRLVMDITQRIRRSLNLQETLQTTVDEVRQFLGCDRVIIFQFFPNNGGTAVVESVAAGWKSVLAENIYDTCFSQKYRKLLQEGLVIAKADINRAAISPCHLEMLKNLQVRANLVVPIANKEQLWGLLIAHHCAESREWQSSEIALLQQLANKVSIAIQQSIIFEQLQTELTERKQIEVALRQSEQRYRSLVHATSQIVWRTDGDGMAIIAPDNWEEITGQTAIEHLGCGWLKCVHPDERDRVAATWQAAYQNRTLYETEYRLRMKDGNYRDFSVRGVPILDADDTISEWIGICIDITKQKQAEAALQENQIQLQRQLAEIETIYQSAPIGLSVLDTNLRFVRINQRLAQINGVCVEEHIGRTLREIIPDLADTAEQLLRPILETGEPFLNVEISGETPAQPGVRRTWLESFLPLKDGDCVIGISVVCEEITERKQAQEALRQSEERYRTLFNSIDEAFCILEMLFDENQTVLDYRLLEVNPQFDRQTGLQDVVGKTMRQLVPNLEACWFEIFGRVALTGEPIRFEQYSLVMKRWFDVYALRIGDESSRKLAIVFQNITQRKQAEEELKQAKEELEIRVAQRTAQLTQINTDLQHSESILRSFFDSSVMLMGIVELHENNILHISDNRAAAQFFGTTPEAMQNCFVSDLGMPQSVIQQWVSYYRQAQQTQAPLRFEYFHETENYSKWLSASVCLIAVSGNGYPRFSYIVEDITESKRAKEHIEASLREKEVLLKEIHHRVKNNLAIVSSLLQMQSRRTQDTQAHEILRDSHNRIASIALIHETLYSSENLANIDFPQYIAQLINHLLDSYNVQSQQIKITTQIEQVSLDIEMAIPCGLIINELVSNALKYAFPDKNDGEIWVKLYQDGQELILLIQDNGIGLPENFNSNKSKKLGINLVRGLVQQLRGSIAINSQQGAEFRICFQI